MANAPAPQPAPAPAPVPKAAPAPAPAPKAAPAPAPQIDGPAARKFLEGFAIDKENVANLDDARALELYGEYHPKYGMPAKWPDDWRAQIAGNDDKTLKRLERYGSPRDVANALLAAQSRISSGELRSALKEGATPEETAAWRLENGIPDKPEAYVSDLPAGKKWLEGDKPFVDAFLKDVALPANMRQEQVSAALAWYHADRERQIEQLAARDATEAQATEDQLRAEWGNEYPRARTGIMSLLDMMPKGVKELILNARGADDRALFNNPDVLRGFDALRRVVNPLPTPLHAGGENLPAAIDDELGKLTKMMGDHKSEYWKGANAEKNQARYRELSEWKERQAAGQKKAA